MPRPFCPRDLRRSIIIGPADECMRKLKAYRVFTLLHFMAEVAEMLTADQDYDYEIS